MESPENVPALRQFLGMANQLGKFSPCLAELTKPLRELLSKNREWQWTPAHDEACRAVKLELSKPSILAHYDSTAPTKLSADASVYGHGAVLLQEHDSVWKPVAYASRSMTTTEQN